MNAAIWHNGLPVEVDQGTTSGQLVPLDLQPGSNELLMRVQGTGEAQRVSLAVQAREGIHAVLPEKLDSSLLAERLRQAAESGSGESLAAEFAALDWPAEARSGDAAKGRALFGSLGCSKCHAITSDQKGGGAPSLAEAWRRFTVPHMVESVLLPSKQIAAPFKGITIRTVDGVVLSGLVVAETAAELELLQPDGSRRTVAISDIEERKSSEVSPMPFGVVKTPAELRDLLAYLQLQSPVPP